MSRQYRYRVILDRDGSLEGDDFKVWHVLMAESDDVRLLCNGVAIGPTGEIEVETREVPRGGITCPACLRYVKAIKGIRL